MTVSHVLVLGGGILGMSTAVHLLRAGTSVTLITEDELASGASGRSLSWINSAGVRSDAYHRLRALGADRYRTMFAADPSRDWLRFDGGLWWGAPDAPEAARERHEHEVEHGYDSHLIGCADLKQHVPGVASGDPEALAVHNPGEGWVSLPHLIDELAEEARRLGGDLVLRAGRCSVVVEDGRACGVLASDGRTWHGDAVVVACGAATPAVLAEIGVTVADASPLSMLVITEPVSTDLRAVLNTPRAAMRPNPGGTFAVDHDWFEDQIIEDDNGGCSVDRTVVEELMSQASALFADEVSLRPASWSLGRKPVPGDNQPVIGEVPAVPGCFVLFTHSGATLGLIAGELTAYEVVTGLRHPLLSEFRPERFHRAVNT